MTVKCCMLRWPLHVWQHQRQPRLPHPPLTDYSVAVARAIAWLQYIASPGGVSHTTHDLIIGLKLAINL